MIKINQRDKRSKDAVEKQPKVKNPILQAYFTSLLSMVLCVSMFLGTSYAWFTSEVENTGNEIYIGTLDVGLEKLVSDGDGADTKSEYKSLAEKDTDGNNVTHLFDDSTPWCPGYTSLETIRIVNEGDLDFKYVLNLIEGTLVEPQTTDGESIQTEGEQLTLADVAQYFEVWVYDYAENAKQGRTYSAPASYQTLGETNSGWAYIGTLQEILSGKPVLEGEKLESAKNADTTATAGEDPTVKQCHTYTIAIHMRSEADASVMGKRIALNVKLVAYQLMAESGDVVVPETNADGTTNEEDSANNTIGVTNLSTLTTALAEGQNVLLTTDIAIDDVAARLTMNGGILEGNNNTITYAGGREGSASVGVLTCNGGTIRNVTITGGENGRALYVTSLSDNLVVSNCTLSGAYAFNLNSAEDTDFTMTFEKTIFNSWTSYANVTTHVTFTDCTFEDILRPYGDTTLSNCVFSKETLDVSKLEVGETITLTGCTYGVTENVSLVVAHVTGEDGESQITVKGIDSQTVNVSIDTNGCLTFGNAG